MAKKEKGSVQYALRFGHPTDFRRTIKPAKGKPYQLVFESGQLYNLSDDEVAFLEREIATGILVEAAKDPKGRFRYLNQQANKATADAEATIANLEAKVEELSATNAKLSADLAALTKNAKDDSTSNTDSQ